MNAPGLKLVAGKPVPMERPASRLPAAQARVAPLEEELTLLRAQRPAAALACAERIPGAGARLAELHRAISLAEFELASNGAAQDRARYLDQAALDAWRQDVAALPPEEMIFGISRDSCAARCRPGMCALAFADAIPSDCLHPVRAGPMNLIRHKSNSKIVATYSAALAITGKR
jgi:hypothetical protein